MSGGSAQRVDGARIIQIVADSHLEMARQALDRANGDTERAAFFVTEQVKCNPNFLKEHLDAIVQGWAKDLIQKLLTRTREAALRPTPMVDGSAMRNAIAANAVRMMDMPLWGGKPISQANADEIRDSADSYTKQGRDMLRKASWQTAVANALDKNGNPGDRVADCLTEATLSKLWEEANGE